MTTQLTPTKRLAFTAAVALLVGSQLIWDHFHGGVPVHYMLHNPDLPAISNWWSLLIIPVLTWIALLLVDRRINKLSENNRSIALKKALQLFVFALIYGFIVGLFFTLDITVVSDTGTIIVFALSFLIPLYRIEYLLGFVLGLTYFIGGTLPTFFGLILMGIYFITYKVGQFIINQFKSKKTTQ